MTDVDRHYICMKHCHASKHHLQKAPLYIYERERERAYREGTRDITNPEFMCCDKHNIEACNLCVAANIT